jgi:hypothetical protein
VFVQVAQLSVERPTSAPDIQTAPSSVIAMEVPSRAPHRVHVMPWFVERNKPEVLETAYQSPFGAIVAKFICPPDGSTSERGVPAASLSPPPPSLSASNAIRPHAQVSNNASAIARCTSPS